MVRIASILSGGLVIVLVTLGISVPVAIVANADNARQAQIQAQIKNMEVERQLRYDRDCMSLSATVRDSPEGSFPVSDRGECLTRTPVYVGLGDPA